MPAAVAPVVQNALRILRAELRDGCRDRVVIGGLEGFVRNLQAQAGAADLRAAAQSLHGYAGLDGVTRAARLRQAIDALGDETQPAPSGASAGVTPAPRRTAPAPREPVAPGCPPVPSGAPEDAEAPPRVRSQPPPAGVTPETPMEALKGIGPKRGRLYARLGLQRVRDLLFHFPLRHAAYPPPTRVADLFFQAEGSVVGLLDRVDVEDLPRGLKKLRALVRDDSGVVAATWLRHGYAHLGLRPGESIALSGKLLPAGRQMTFENPEYERGDGPPLHTRGLVPVYPLTAGLLDKELRTRVHWAVTHFADSLPDPLPAAVRAEHRLLPLAEALRSLHFPTSRQAFEEARRRFAFEELLTIQLVVLQRRRVWQQGGAPALPRRQPALDAFAAALPFALTSAQARVVDEILADAEQPRPMTRLLQGEVGSGKTAVAALALVNALANGYQGALMAPTEILAEQHFATLGRLFEGAAAGLEACLGRQPVVRLLTGSVKGKARQAVYRAVEAGAADVLVGTQALIQETLEFARLGLVVVDEQHRFGVKQRVTLRRRTQDGGAGTPHLLVMTATPIPRTLALSLYGDLDLSVLDELPPGRQQVRTVLLSGADRGQAYEKVRREAARGRQAFVICPLVEESEVLEAKAATEEFARLQAGELSSLRLALLHGRMKPAEKDGVMRAFRDGQFDVLVSTAVVEVGVDVPNATVMLIEGAERFGLAQLHQFRGRVGRGEHASVCVLLTDQENPEANERLRVMERSTSGLELAEHDLRLRGPGDYFGVRQSGFPDLQMARLDDAVLVETARAAAARILDVDASLARPEHESLRAHIVAFKERVGDPS